MKARVAASVTLAIGVALGLSACNLIAPQATLKHYDASDGIGVTLPNGVAVRNALLVSDDTGTELIATVIDPSGLGGTLTVQPDSDASGKKAVTVQPGTSPTVIAPGSTTVEFQNRTDIKPGDLYPLYFSFDGTSFVKAEVPVLTDDLYKQQG